MPEDNTARIAALSSDAIQGFECGIRVIPHRQIVQSNWHMPVLRQASESVASLVIVRKTDDRKNCWSDVRYVILRKTDLPMFL